MCLLGLSIMFCCHWTGRDHGHTNGLEGKMNGQYFLETIWSIEASPLCRDLMISNGKIKRRTRTTDFSERDILAVRLSVFSVSPFPFRGALFRLCANAHNLSGTLLLQ